MPATNPVPAPAHSAPAGPAAPTGPATTAAGPPGARSAAIYAAIDPARAAGGHLTLNASLGGRK
jgi:hypothetical protein